MQQLQADELHAVAGACRTGGGVDHIRLADPIDPYFSVPVLNPVVPGAILPPDYQSIVPV